VKLIHKQEKMSMQSLSMIFVSGVILFLQHKRRISHHPRVNDGENGKQYVFVNKPPTDEEWIPALPNMSKEQMRMRPLYREPVSGRFALELVIGPNQKYPSHLHGSNEWCFLIQGEMSDQFGKKFAGDFFYNENRSLHYGIQAGPEGCTILVVKDFGTNIPRPELD
jgi:hypothetical protein